ncbi:MAG TPA: tripartite tricarboxylate transporter substrate binding protein [Ramlibacter sp.]|jgi:tripartite-type tricarboxylate transporter receptor subunit TctC|nr:tripartite tricarboxylate transporter substrate binding protein [Ramlibacter sp.]
MRHAFLRSLSTAVLACAALAAHGQAAYPTRPVSLVVGYAPGGGTDLIARAVAQKLGDVLGQPVIVENRAGAQAIIAAQHVAKSNPDGYTLMLGPTGPVAMNPALHSKLPYTPLKDFAPISMVGTFPLVLAVGQNHPAQNVQQLVDYARANPSKANYGASATPFQLATELFKQKTGTAFQYIAYKGTNESIHATSTGEVTMTIADPAVVIGPHKAGRVRPLAVTSGERHPGWPGVPTLRELGFSELEMNLWVGLLAPAGTPPAILRRLNEAVAAVVKDPGTREKLANLGIDAVSSTPEEFRDVIARDTAKWTAVARAANIKAD